MGNIVKFGGAPVWVQGEVKFLCPPVGALQHKWLVEDIRPNESALQNITQWVGAFSVLDGSGGLEIGEYTIISPGVHIYSHVNKLPLSGSERPVVKIATKIGSHVYLGPNVVVAAGVSIGDGAIVGAGCFIDKDVLPGVKITPKTQATMAMCDFTTKIMEGRAGDV